jgi:hypothetical protein
MSQNSLDDLVQGSKTGPEYVRTPARSWWLGVRLLDGTHRAPGLVVPVGAPALARCSGKHGRTVILPGTAILPGPPSGNAT